MVKKRMGFRDKVRKSAEKAKNETTGFGYLNLPHGVPIFSPKPGSRVLLDILPYEVTSAKHPDRDDESEIAIPGSYWYRRPFKIHRNVGPEKDVVICPTSFGKKCPICEYRTKLFREGAEKSETDVLKTSKRVLYAIIPVGSKDYDEKIHIWDMSYYLFQDLLDDELNEDPDVAIFPDLEEGYTLKIRFDSDSFGGGKPFARASRIDFLERDTMYEEDILDKVPKLDEILHELSYDELTKLFFELDDEDVKQMKQEQGNESEEEKPVRRRKKVIRQEEDPGDQPEEEKPVRRRRPVKREIENEPEEEKPVRRRRPVKREIENEPEEEQEEIQMETGGHGCPYGHKFGVDTDQFEDCDTCEIWDACIEQKESNT